MRDSHTINQLGSNRTVSQDTRRIFVWQLLVVSLLAGFGCTGSSSKHTPEEVRAQAIWHRHEGVLAKGMEGRRNSDEFSAAVAFFREVSGVEVSVHLHPVMRPKPEALAWIIHEVQ